MKELSRKPINTGYLIEMLEDRPDDVRCGLNDCGGVLVSYYVKSGATRHDEIGKYVGCRCTKCGKKEGRTK